MRVGERFFFSVMCARTCEWRKKKPLRWKRKWRRMISLSIFETDGFMELRRVANSLCPFLFYMYVPVDVSSFLELL